MIVKSFGCSFVFGTDLPDAASQEVCAKFSRLTWPALIAQHLNFDYQCYAKPGAGNLQILERLLSQPPTSDNDLYIISWTWIDRFDYVDPDQKSHQNIMLPPYTSWATVMPIDNTDLAKNYYKYLHSQYQDKLSTLIYMKIAVDYLKQHNIKFIMTYMDKIAFENECSLNSTIAYLQKNVSPYMWDFEGKTFLNWCQDLGFPISDTLHPLETAHKSAAELVIRSFDIQNTNDPIQPVLS